MENHKVDVTVNRQEKLSNAQNISLKRTLKLYLSQTEKRGHYVKWFGTSIILVMLFLAYPVKGYILLIAFTNLLCSFIMSDVFLLFIGWSIKTKRLVISVLMQITILVLLHNIIPISITIFFDTLDVIIIYACISRNRLWLHIQMQKAESTFLKDMENLQVKVEQMQSKIDLLEVDAMLSKDKLNQFRDNNASLKSRNENLLKQLSEIQSENAEMNKYIMQMDAYQEQIEQELEHFQIKQEPIKEESASGSIEEGDKKAAGTEDTTELEELQAIPEHHKQILDLLKQGKSTRAIGELCGCSRQTVCNIKKKYQVSVS